MSRGIKIHVPLPLSLEGVGLPTAFMAIDEYFIELTAREVQKGKETIAMRSAGVPSEKKKHLKKELGQHIRLQGWEVVLEWDRHKVHSDDILLPALAAVEEAGRFLELKSFPGKIERSSQVTSYQLEKYQQGRIFYDTGEQWKQLPYPSGWCFALMRGNFQVERTNPSDRNAFLLAEACYRNHPGLLKNMGPPPDAITAIDHHIIGSWPLIATNELFLIFINSHDRNEFLKKVGKPYYCMPVNLCKEGLRLL